DEVTGELTNSWAARDFFRGDVVGGSKREIAALVLAALEEGASGVDEQAGSALGDGDLFEVDAAGGVDRGSGVAEGDGDVDAVELDVDRAEGRPAEVRVGAELVTGGVGFV